MSETRMKIASRQDVLDLLCSYWGGYLKGYLPARECSPWWLAFREALGLTLPEASKAYPHAQARLSAAWGAYQASYLQGEALEELEEEAAGTEVEAEEDLGDVILEMAEQLAQASTGWGHHLPGLRDFEDEVLDVHVDAGDIAGHHLLQALRVLPGGLLGLPETIREPIGRAVAFLNGERFPIEAEARRGGSQG